MHSLPILNIHQFEKETSLTDFYCNDLSKHLEKNKKLVYKPHKHDFYLCILFTEGTGLHEIDFTTFTVQPGAVFFLKPGQTHSWQFDSTPNGYIFFHTQSFYELNFSSHFLTQFPFYYSQKNTPALYINADETQYLATKFKELYQEYQQINAFQELKITSLLNAIYIDLARLYIHLKPQEVNSSIRYMETLRLLENEIDKHYLLEKSASFYANALHISPKHLNRIVKTTLNKTTSELIMERVILEAKRMIVHTQNSLSHISETLGFEDYAYFSRVFKTKVGITPLGFKKRYL